MLHQSTSSIKNKKGFSPTGEKSTASSPALFLSTGMNDSGDTA